MKDAKMSKDHRDKIVEKNRDIVNGNNFQESGELPDDTLENSSRITVNSSKKESIPSRNDDNYEDDCFGILNSNSIALKSIIFLVY